MSRNYRRIGYLAGQGLIGFFGITSGLLVGGALIGAGWYCYVHPFHLPF